MTSPASKIINKRQKEMETEFFEARGKNMEIHGDPYPNIKRIRRPEQHEEPEEDNEQEFTCESAHDLCPTDNGWF
jgi:hypothetical protein